MTEPEYLWFAAPCPNCGNELTNLKTPRELWGMPGLSGSETFTCPGCKQQVAAREERSPDGESRLVVSMHTLPAGAAMPADVVARQVDAPPLPPVGAPAESIDELFERVVEPWREANRDTDEPDFAALAEAVEPYPPKWRAVAWQDVGRSGPRGQDPTGWLRTAQCYAEALRHNSDPNFLGWHTTFGETEWDPEQNRLTFNDPEAAALSERARARGDLDDAGRAQLAEELRRYVGAPGEPFPSRS